MATKNIVPRGNNEGKLGTDEKRWNTVIAETASFTTFSGSITGNEFTLFSGSATSTASFGFLMGNGRGLSNLVATADPAGSDTHVQFNDDGSTGGDAGLVYNKTTDVLQVAGAVSGSATSTGSFGYILANTDIDTANNLYVGGGVIDLKNTGAQSVVRFYCESSNAHYAEIQAPAHSDFSGDVTLTLPVTAGTLALDADVATASDISGSFKGELSGSHTTFVGGGASGSSTSTGSFGAVIADGSQLTNLQRPITTHATNFTASVTYAGHYNIVGGNITCSILAEATATCPVGAEFEFFQTSSAGNFLFESGSGVSVYSKDLAANLTGQYSAASLKKVATDTWHLVGDLS